MSPIRAATAALNDSSECFRKRFLVVLSEEVNATIEDCRAVGTVEDDDPVE